MVEVGRDLWRATALISLLKQGHLELVAQDHVQMASAYLHGYRLHGLSGKPVSMLSHLHSEKVFPDVQREPSVFQCMPTASGPATGHHLSEPGPGFFAPFIPVFTHIQIPLEPSSLLQTEQSQLFQPFLIGKVLQSLNLCGHPLD